MKNVLCVLLIFVAGCGNLNKEKTDPPKNHQNSLTKKLDSEPGKRTEKLQTSNEKKEKRPAKPGVSSKKECLETNVGDKLILASQTFSIDFEPFKGDCFVTAYNAEYDNPPIGSEIGIYRNGERVYEFDTRYHADAATCWIEAVAFQDLNNDKLKDIIVAGKCGAKSGEIQGNEIFINNGKGFDTDVKINDKTEKLKSIKEIAKFVKENKQLFVR